MPRNRSWLARTDEIRARLLKASSPLIDRAALEELFHLKPRQAANLLREITGQGACEVVGGAHALRREALLAFLEARGSKPEARTEALRKVHLAQTLRAIRAAGPPLRADRQRAAPGNPASPLPSGIRVAGPGCLEIAYHSPGEVLGAILALAELAESDPAQFARALESGPEGDAEEEEG